MANWIGTARSNYFKVKDRAAFEKRMNEIEIKVLPGTGETEGKVACAADSESGGWTYFMLNEDEDDDIEIEPALEIAEHLVDGEIAVLMSAGAEKLRYVTGNATAVNHKGECRHISLDDIYKIAEQAFGATVTDAAY